MASKRRVRRRPKPGNNEDPTQGDRILRALERWLAATPGRSFTVARTPDGYTARLDETQSASGTTLTDAAAQIAVAAQFMTPGPDEAQS